MQKVVIYLILQINLFLKDCYKEYDRDTFEKCISHMRDVREALWLIYRILPDFSENRENIVVPLDGEKKYVHGGYPKWRINQLNFLQEPEDIGEI